MIGTILGLRYELLEKIGDGGMSEVYKAKCNKLNRYVAVKVLKKEFANNIEISTKFRREATAVANLLDANIVGILDVGTQDDIDYIVMEYINGSTLKEVIRHNGKLSNNTAIKIALQIAKALDCAHKNNIIHRDIKPQNILVTESGEIKVTDFGIAKLADSKTMTNTTSVIGSAHYLSPEQAKGGYIDGRSDIYSFGILFYEMVTGKLPFDGESPVTVALKHIQEVPVSPKDINPTILSSINELILKCIEKEPIRRYQNVKELILDLNKIKENPDVVLINKVEPNSEKTIIMPSLTNEKFNTNSTKINKNDAYEEEEEEDKDDKKSSKTKKKTILTIIGVVVAILLLATIGYFIAVGNNKLNSEIPVPKLVGLSLDKAKEEAKLLGINVEVIGTSISSEEEDTVLTVNPKVGTMIKKGTTLKVTISGGEQTFIMSDFRDYEVTNIKQILDSQGFTNYSIQEEFNDNVKVGYLINQSPSAKTEIKKDTEITIVISKGPETKLVVVPGVVGKKESIAKAELESLNLKVEIEAKITNNINEDGIVLSQSIEGNKVEEGTPVKIYVGKYEEKVEKIINIRSEVGLKEGQTILDAKSKLNSAGIEFSIIGPDDDKAVIVSFTESIKESGSVIITSKSVEVEQPVDPNNQTSPNNQTNP